MKSFWTLFFLGTCSFSSSSVGLEATKVVNTNEAAKTNEKALLAVITLAEKAQLSKTRAWSKLIHDEPNLIGIRKSQITSPAFLVTNQEKFRKYSELEATLRGFATDPKPYEKMIDSPTQKLQKISAQVLDHSQHPICLFPARLKYLKAELSEAVEYWRSLPTVQCVFQNVFLEAMSARSYSYVFSSYYSDSPGSAFGHTFFRVNRTSDATKAPQELLDYGVGYAANVTVSNGFLYAILGLVGGFNGAWTNVPYYYKVREYNDFEARDLWSYDLNLSRDEVEMLTLHLWEVGSNYYTYYFFTQNCAFHMLTVLEAAAPRLHLIENVPSYYVIPSDSLKALFYEPGLVQNISFRPSIRKEFLSRFSGLEPASKEVFVRYSKTQKFEDDYFQKANDKQKAQFVDTAIDLFNLRHQHVNVENDKEFSRQRESLLGRRAQINYISPEVKFDPDLKEQPANSHSSSRFGLSAFNFNHKNYALIEYRFALHDLLDHQVAMPRNSQLEFFNFSFRAKEDSLNLEGFSLFKVLNLNPLNFFETKPSWGFDLGIQNRPVLCGRLNDSCLLSGITAKYGVAQTIFNDDQGLAWTFLTLNARYSSSLPEASTYLASGFEVGLLNRFNISNTVLAVYNYEFPLNRSIQQDYLIEYRKSFDKFFQFGLRAKTENFGAISYWYF